MHGLGLVDMRPARGAWAAQDLGAANTAATPHGLRLRPAAQTTGRLPEKSRQANGRGRPWETVQRGCGRIRPLGAPPAASGQQDFLSLAELSGAEIARGLELAQGGSGRGVFATRSFSPGELMLSVPLSSCFIVGRDGGMSLPGRTLEDLQAGRLEGWPLLEAATSGNNAAIFAELEWDARMALAVADVATSRPSQPSSPASGGPAPGTSNPWDRLLSRLGGMGRRQNAAPASAWLPIYSRLLPQNHPSPLRLRPELLQDAGDKDLAGRALAEQQKVAELLGSPGMAAISALDADLMCWALGMARSRAFDATPGTFVMAPVLDMVNHAWQAPNAEVQLRLASSAPPDEAVLRLEGDVTVCAVKAIPKGEEVLFSYGCNAMPSSDLFLRYGMMRPGGNPFDLLPLAAMAEQAAAEAAGAAAAAGNGPGGTSPQGRAGVQLPLGIIDMAVLEDALKAAVQEDGGRWLQVRTTDGELKAVLASLQPLAASQASSGPAEHQDDSSTPLTSDGNEARIVDAVLDMVAAELSSISEGDLVYPVAKGSDADSIAFLAAYRGRRKSLWAKASWVLETYRKVLMSSKQMADD